MNINRSASATALLHFLPRQPSQEHHPIVEAEPVARTAPPTDGDPTQLQENEHLAFERLLQLSTNRQTLPAHKAAGPSEDYQLRAGRVRSGLGG